MNINKDRAVVRLNRIKIVQDSILKSEDPDLKKLILMCCSEWGISNRTANEYLKVAQYNIEHA